MLKAIERFLDAYDTGNTDKVSIFSEQYPRFFEKKHMFNIQLFLGTSDFNKLQHNAVISFEQGCYIRIDDAEDSRFYISKEDENFTYLKYNLKRWRRSGATEFLLSSLDNNSMFVELFDIHVIPMGRHNEDEEKSINLFVKSVVVKMRFERITNPERPNYTPRFFNTLLYRESRHFNFEINHPINVSRNNPVETDLFSNYNSILADDMWIYIQPTAKMIETSFIYDIFSKKKEESINGIVTLRNSGHKFLSFEIIRNLCSHSKPSKDIDLEMKPIETAESFVEILHSHKTQDDKPEITFQKYDQNCFVIAIKNGKYFHTHIACSFATKRIKINPMP